MCFAKGLLVLVVVLGALEVRSVEGISPKRLLRPTKMVHQGAEEDHHPTQHPTVKPSHYQPSIASPAHSADYQWRPPVPRPNGEKEHYPSQHPTYDSSHYQPSSPPAYGQHQWQQPSQHSPPSPRPTVVDEYNKRFPDGSYEFRYETSDGSVRYECGYFIWFQQKRILVVKGYYSYPLSDHTFYTVFYTADQYGFREDSALYTEQKPFLPKSLSGDLAHEDGLRNFAESEVDSVEHEHDHDE